MDVLVAGWIGSTNLGDELVFAGMRRLLGSCGVGAVALSVDPAGTRREHGVEAVAPYSVAAWERAGSAAGVVLGGGGLIQDETSPFNLPYHLGRVVALAEARGRPWVGLGLGVGPVTGAVGRRLAGGVLGRAVAVSVRDGASAEALRGLGVGGAGGGSGRGSRRGGGGPEVVVAADLAFHLDPPAVEPADEILVCLREWGGTSAGSPGGESGLARAGQVLAASVGQALPVEWRRRLRGAGAGSGRDAGPAVPDWFAPTVAGQLDALSERTGLPVRFVALQADRDHAVHEVVAERMRASVVGLETPGLSEVLAAVGGGRLVVSMRYHGAVAAVLAGRPAATIGYSPKVSSLASEAGGGVAGVAWHRGALADLAAVAGEVVGRDDEVAAGREQLVARAAGNRQGLERLLERGA